MKPFSKIAPAVACACGLAGAQTQSLPEPAPSNTLLACEQQQGFQLLFSGTLSSFQGNFATWKSGNTTNTDIDTRWTLSTADSAITTSGTVSDLRSRTMYGDFDMRFTYRNSGNQGLFYKTLARGCCAWATGVEFGIDDGSTGKTVAGAAYDIFAPSPYTYQKYSTGKWNTVRVVSKADSIEHWMNNQKVVGYKFWNARWNTAIAASKWNGAAEFAQQTDGCKCMINPGWIGFQGDHGGAWLIKNFRINSNPSTVNVGPAQCPTPVEGELASKPAAFSMERISQGLLRVNLLGEKATRVEVIDSRGKNVAVSALERNGSSALIRGWQSPGIYFLRVKTRHGNSSPSKIFLP